MFADKDYIVSPTERLTYAQTHAEVERVANMLRSRGVVKGETVPFNSRMLPPPFFFTDVSCMFLPLLLRDEGRDCHEKLCRVDHQFLRHSLARR